MKHKWELGGSYGLGWRQVGIAVVLVGSAGAVAIGDIEVARVCAGTVCCGLLAWLTL